MWWSCCKANGTRNSSFPTRLPVRYLLLLNYCSNWFVRFINPCKALPAVLMAPYDGIMQLWYSNMYLSDGVGNYYLVNDQVIRIIKAKCIWFVIYSVILYRSCKCRGHGQETKETVEIPYTLIRTPFGEITGFWPSLLDPSSPGLTLTPMKCVQNKKLKIYHSGFNYLLLEMDITWNKVREFGIYPNFALPTGGPEITEILREQLDYWIGRNCWLTDTRTHTYILSFKKITKFNTFDTLHLFLLYVLIPRILKLHTKVTKDSPPQRPDPSQVAALLAFEGVPGVHHKRRPLGMTEIT